MIDRLLEIYEGVVDRVVLIVHPSAEETVRRKFGAAVDVFVQYQPSGMLDAIMLAAPAAERDRPRRILITWCDQVAIHPATVARIRAVASEIPAPALAMPTCMQPEPYIHLERDAAALITRVLHRREGDTMPKVGESDAGLFDLSLQAYLDWLPQYAREAAAGRGTGERNFLPFIAWISSRAPVVTFPCLEPEEAIGINTPAELARIERHLRHRSRI
jgi:bifunctional N-acetylglucosamine-1-phosphate-uridyltransferase/glucosamine-1-phosphate-acetyltransferase GlmU-like protein